MAEIVREREERGWNQASDRQTDIQTETERDRDRERGENNWKRPFGKIEKVSVNDYLKIKKKIGHLTLYLFGYHSLLSYRLI